MIPAHVESLFYLRGHEIYPTGWGVFFVVWFVVVAIILLARSTKPWNK